MEHKDIDGGLNFDLRCRNPWAGETNSLLPRRTDCDVLMSYWSPLPIGCNVKENLLNFTIRNQQLRRNIYSKTSFKTASPLNKRNLNDLRNKITTRMAKFKAPTLTTAPVSCTSPTSMPTENSDFTPVIMWVSVGVGCLLLICVVIVCFLKRHKLQVNRKFSVLYKRYFGFSLREAMKGNLPRTGGDNSVSRDDTDDKPCIYVNESAINFKTFSELSHTFTGSTKSTTSRQGEHIYSVCNYGSDVLENLEEPYTNIKPTIFSGTKPNISGRCYMADNSSYVSLYDEPQFVEPTTPTSNVYGSSLDTSLNIYFNVDYYSSRNKTLARTERKFHEMKNALCYGCPGNIQSLDGSAKSHPYVHSHRLYVNCPNMVQLESRKKHNRLQTISKKPEERQTKI